MNWTRWRIVEFINPEVLQQSAEKELNMDREEEREVEEDNARRYCIIHANMCQMRVRVSSKMSYHTTYQKRDRSDAGLTELSRSSITSTVVSSFASTVVFFSGPFSYEPDDSSTIWSSEQSKPWSPSPSPS